MKNSQIAQIIFSGLLVKKPYEKKNQGIGSLMSSISEQNIHNDLALINHNYEIVPFVEQLAAFIDKTQNEYNEVHNLPEQNKFMKALNLSLGGEFSEICMKIKCRQEEKDFRLHTKVKSSKEMLLYITPAGMPNFVDNKEILENFLEKKYLGEHLELIFHLSKSHEYIEKSFFAAKMDSELSEKNIAVKQKKI